jgi:hypothetical protein
MRSICLFLVAIAALGLVAAGAAAQQVTIGSPYRTNSSSFFEHNGISWGGNYRGMNFSFGNANLANTPFGGYQPGAGLNTNFAVAGRHGQANFALDFSQGSRQSLTSQTPMVTLMNGQTGYFSDTSQTPFVISHIPVVGGFPTIGAVNPFAGWPSAPVAPPPWVDQRAQIMRQAQADAAAAGNRDMNLAPAPVQRLPQGPPPKARMMNVAPEPVPVAQPGAASRLAAAQASSAGRAAPSVAEARRLHEQEKAAAQGDLEVMLERGITAEAAGKPAVARIYYQKVIKSADGPLRAQAQERLDSLLGVGDP